MKLHCEICALYDPLTGFTRQGPHSEIAVIGEDVSLPLEASMFKSLMPERGLPPPWANGAQWNTMKCPRGGHNIFVMSDDRAQQAMKDGGPNELLTDEGFLRVSKKEVAEEVVEIQEEPEPKLDENKPGRDALMKQLRETGLSYAKIGKQFGVTGTRASQIINQYQRKQKRKK